MVNSVRLILCQIAVTYKPYRDGCVTLRYAETLQDRMFSYANLSSNYF